MHMLTKRFRKTAFLLLAGCMTLSHAATAARPDATTAALLMGGGQPGAWHIPIRSSQSLEVGGATLQVDIAAGALDLESGPILQWIQNAAQAVTVYYGRFPVPRARVLIVPVGDKRGIVQGTTWGGMGGFPGFTRIRLGQHTTQSDLADDWTMTHELVHMAFPELPDDQHWMEEGLATYVEPIARVQAGTLKPEKIWSDMVSGMHKGEPGPGDRGLNRTHSWGRTYWGGGLFCLVADVAIRRQTGNRKGMQDALRAIMAAGGTIDNEWSLSRALEIGDRATGTTVLTAMYKRWGETPVQVDLPALWDELGVHAQGDSVELSPNAPSGKIRESITARPADSPKR